MVKAVLVLLAIFGVAQCKPQTPPKSPEEIDAWATQIFNTYDKNGDNKWSFEEATECMKKDPGMQANFKEMFEMVAGADGEPGITFDEHFNGRKKFKPQGSPEIDEKTEKMLFDRFDTNGNGIWTLDEANQFQMFAKFNDVDGNKDGIITLDEHKKAFRMAFGIME